MGLFPIIMNVLQFWLIDSIVKAHTPPPSRLGADDGDREPLFLADGSDEEDGTLDEPEPLAPKYGVEGREPLTLTTTTIVPHPRPLTPESRSFPSGSSTPFHVEVEPNDVAMRRVQSPSPPPAQHPTAAKSTNPTVGDEWGWDEAGEWDTKRSLDALRPHHD